MEDSRFGTSTMISCFSQLFFFFSSKDLSDWAESRGLKCKACAEKADWVKMVWENKDTPEKPKPTPKPEEESSSDDKDSKTEEIEKMLKNAGIKGKKSLVFLSLVADGAKRSIIPTGKMFNRKV